MFSYEYSIKLRTINCNYDRSADANKNVLLIPNLLLPTLRNFQQAPQGTLHTRKDFPMLHVVYLVCFHLNQDR